MRRFFLVLFAQLSIIVLSYAQYTPYDTTTFVFKLKTEEARLLIDNQEKLDESYFHTLVDSILTYRPSLSPMNYSYGHYLLAKAVGEEVKVGLKSVNTISALVLPNKRDLLIQVYDSLGHQVSNAQVTVGDKDIVYNIKKGGYFKRKWKKEGLVEIKAAGETLFYQLEKQDQGWKLFKARYQYFSNRKIGRILTLPIRLSRRAYYFVRGGINDRGYFRNAFRNMSNRRNAKLQYKGYIAVHQPKYQPGDTVKVKAYIANRKGRPLKKELYLKLSEQNSRGKAFFDIPLLPDTKGNYTYEFVLGDSLKLDKSYGLSFRDIDKWRMYNFTQQFRYEDYQLDEVSWSFSTPKEKFNYKEPIILFAEGKDANGNTIPDGQLRLTILAGPVDKHFENPSYIPDTIWHKVVPLRPREKTQIIVPDSLVPYANMKLIAKAELVNSNGEIHQESKTFEVERNRERIHAEIRDGFVYAEYYKDGKRIDTTGVVEYWFNDDVDMYPEEEIRFPVKQKINPYVLDYDFMVDDTYTSLSLEDGNNGSIQSNVNISGYWRDGVAQFVLTNPHQIPVHYTILTKDRLVLQDSSSANGVIFSKSKYQGAYYVNYTFVWGGQAYKKSNEIRPYKKQLNITVHQADKVRPGDLVDTEIEVLNYKGKKVKGVNLTAGAYNAQFKQTNNFTAPQIEYKIKRSPFAFTNFLLEQTTVQLRALPMSSSFYQELNLQDHFFYYVRYDNPDGMILHYDSISAPQYASLAQVSPYLIKDGKEIPAEMIYVNSKLVYYAGTTIPQPYSFLGYEGSNTMVLRTKDTEYKFLNVQLKKGHKLEMIVNLNTIEQSTYADNFSAKGVEPILNVQEKKILNLSLFQYKSRGNGKNYIWQDNEPVFVINPTYRYTNHILGPLAANRSTGFVAQDLFIRRFYNSPYFQYEIFPTQERLYANTLFDLEEKIKLFKRTGFHNMGGRVNTTADIITQRPKLNSIPFGAIEFKDDGDVGKYAFRFQRDTSLIAVVMTTDRDSLIRILRPHYRSFENIKAGKYQFYFFTKEGYYSKHSFTIKASHLLYEDLSELTYQRDSLETLSRFTTILPPSPEKKLDDYSAQFLKKKQNGIIGRIRTPQPDSTSQVFQLNLFKDDLFVAETKTDSSGYYELKCYPGIYDLSIQNPKDNSAFKFPIFVSDSSAVRIDLIYHQRAFYLNQIEVIGYTMPLMKQDNTTQGSTVTSEEIRNLPTRSIKGLASRATEVTITEEGLNIRGGRTDATVYYIDGVQVRGDLIPESEINSMHLSQVATGTITDSEGEGLIGCSVMLVIDGNIITGTITDVDGRYSLRVPNGSYELQISYIGFESKSVSVNSSSQQIDVTLDEGVTLFEEIVVVGYGGSKSLATSSNLQLQADEPPVLEGGVQLRSDFRDYAYWEPNLITDKEGKASFQTIFPDKLTSWRTFVIGMNKKSQAGVAYANTKSFKPLVAQLSIPRFLIAGDQSSIIGKSVNYTAEVYPVKTKFLQAGEVIQTNDAEVKEALIEIAEINAPLDVDSLSITYNLIAGDYGDGENREIPIFPNGIEETIGGFYVLEGDTTIQIEFDPKKGPVTIYSQSDMLDLMLEDLDYLVRYPYGCNEQTASRLMALLLEKQVRAQLSQPFEHEDKVIKMIVRLKKSQNEDGSWGWWSNNPRSTWITTHVLKALSNAKNEGYTTSAFEKGIRFVTNFLPATPPRQQLPVLALLSSIGQPTTYETYLSEIDTLDLTLKEQYTVINIKQEQNLPYILDSLETYRRTNLFGGDYWGNESWDIMSENVDLSLLAYKIYNKEKNQKRLNALSQYFLMRRSDLSNTYGRRFGRNTYETVKILATLLPDLLSKNKSNGITANELIIEGSSSNTVTKFPFKQVMNNESSLRIKKKGTGTLFLTTYQEFFNTSPSAKNDVFDIQTRLLQNKKPLTKLKQGERVQLVVDVKVDKDVTYAMVEIPIPAACSYFSKPNVRHGVEVHREYFKNKTAIFCEKLPKGTHKFVIDLEVRFAGQYTLLPSKAEQMYFPIFYGRNEVKEVKVE